MAREVLKGMSHKNVREEKLTDFILEIYLFYYHLNMLPILVNSFIFSIGQLSVWELNLGSDGKFVASDWWKILYK